MCSCSPMCPPGYHHTGYVATRKLGHMIFSVVTTEGAWGLWITKSYFSQLFSRLLEDFLCICRATIYNPTVLVALFFFR